MVSVVQLVRASDCGSECRGFESHQTPKQSEVSKKELRSFVYITETPTWGGGSDKPNAKTSFFVWLVSRLVVTLHLQTIYCEKNTFFALCPGFGDSSDVPADKRSNRLAASESADVCSRKRVLLFLRAHRYSHSRPPHKRRCGVQLWDVRLEETSLRVELHHGAY